MKSVVFLSLVIFFSVLPKNSQQTFWRRPEPTLPSDPNSPVYQKLRQNIPSPQKTAQSILDNFIRYQPGVGKRQIKMEDIVLIMDGSGSVSSCQFDYGRDGLIASMKVCEEEEKKGISSCRSAAITFGSSANVKFNFLSSAQAIEKMKSIPYPGGSTNTQAALAEAEQLLRRGSRRFSKLKVLLMTDGQSNVRRDLTVPNAEKLKGINVEIFVVAVGNTNMRGIPEMVRVASSPPETHVFRVERNSDMKYAFELALEKINYTYKAKKPLPNPCP